MGGLRRVKIHILPITLFLIIEIEQKFLLKQMKLSVSEDFDTNVKFLSHILFEI